MKSERVLIVAGFVVISLIWGSTWLAIKIGLESVPPLFAVALRFGLAMLILSVVIRVRGEQIPHDRTAVVSYLTLAFLSFSFPFALVYWGEQYISSGLASILFAMYPFVVAILSHFFLAAERLNSYKVIGILLGFFGVVLIFWSDIRFGEMSMEGMIAVVASSVLQATSLVIIKRRGTHISPTALSFGGLIGAVVILFALAFVFEDVSDIHLDGKGIGSILYLGTFGTVATFLTYYWLLKRIEAVYLSLVALVTPVLAVILGALLLAEELNSRVYAGAVLILAGILITNGKDLLLAIHNHKKQLFS